MSVLAEKPMARVRGKKSERDDVAVKVDRSIVGKSRMIATHQGVSVAELLSSLLASPIDRAYATMLRELDARSGDANHHGGDDAE
jgi:hypothetical protein